MAFVGFIHHSAGTAFKLLMEMQSITNTKMVEVTSPDFPGPSGDVAGAIQFANVWIGKCQQTAKTEAVLVFLEANLAQKAGPMTFDDTFFANHPAVAFVLYHGSPDKIEPVDQNRFVQNHPNIIAFNTVETLIANGSSVLRGALDAARAGPNPNPAVEKAFLPGPRLSGKSPRPIVGDKDADLEPGASQNDGQPNDPATQADVLPARTPIVIDNRPSTQLAQTDSPQPILGDDGTPPGVDEPDESGGV